MLLRNGWEQDEWDYDHYLLDSQQHETCSEAEFFAALNEFVQQPSELRHWRDSDCPE